MADKLSTLLRLRHLQADLARASLGHALAAERAAETALLEAKGAPAREAAGLPSASSNALLAAYAAWLPAAAAHAVRCACLVENTQAARQEAGLVLQAGKRAVEAVEKVQQARQAASTQEAGRKTQSMLDDLAARLRACR
jgi:hypothetical protein